MYKASKNVVNYYGEQRNTSKLEVEEKWKRLRREPENIRARNEFCVFLGDMNKWVGGSDMNKDTLSSF